MRILVSGGKGFLGLHLQHSLSQISEEVFYLPSRTDLITGEMHTKINGIDQVIEVVRNFQPEIVIHLAAFHNAKDDVSEFSRMVESNLTLGAAIMECLPQNSSFIYCGSYNQFELPRKKALNFYSLNKKLFCEIAAYFSEKNNIKVTQLILSDLYGPRDFRPKLIPALFSKLALREAFIPVSPEGVLYPLYVEDAVSMITELCKNPSTTLTRNIYLKPKEAISVKNLIYYANDTFLHKLVVAPQYSDFRISIPKGFEIKASDTGLELGLSKTWNSYHIL